MAAKKKTVKKKDIYFDDSFHKIVVTYKGKKINKISVDGKTYKFSKSWGGKIKNLSRQNKAFGIYVGPETHINILSMYAYNSASGVNGPQLTTATNAVDQVNHPSSWNPGSVARGIKVYDVELTGPAYDSEIILPNGWMDIPMAGTTYKVEITNDSSSGRVSTFVREGLEYQRTPYRAKFTLINNSSTFVPIYSSANMSGLQISAKTLVASEEIEYSKLIGEKNKSSAVIDVSSDWIQSEENAKNLAKEIDKYVKISMDTYQIQVFGNPLVEIGDVVNMNYYQSDITDDAKYVVVGLEESFDGGFETTLTLRKIAN